MGASPSVRSGNWQEWLQDLEEAQIELQNGCGADSLPSALFGRLTEQVGKLGLLHAMSLNPANPVIGLASLQWGYAVARSSIEFVLARATSEIAESDFARLTRKATKYITEQKRVTQSQLLRYLKVPARTLIDVTQWLVETEVVVAQIVKDASKTGRPTTIFQRA